MDASKHVKVPECRSLWSQVLLSGIHNFLSRLSVSVLLQSFSTSECAKMPGRLAHTLILEQFIKGLHGKFQRAVHAFSYMG